MAGVIVKRLGYSVFLCLLLIFSVPPGVFQAEELGLGTYHGYFTIDRWGQRVFHLGPYHLFLSEAVARELEKYRGKPLQLNVSEMCQPQNPGAGMIRALENVSVKGIARGLVLSAKAKSNKIVQGQGLVLQLSLRNSSPEEITIWPGTLAIVLVTNSPFPNDAIDYKDPDDCSYWYYQYAHPSFETGKRLLRIACRRVIMSWTAKTLVEQGQGIRVADKDRGFYGPVVIEPTGKFESEVVVGKELLPDDYEAFFYIATGNLSSVPGPMSGRVAFDVVGSKR